MDGTGLTAGVTLVAPGCTSLIELAGASAAQRNYTCTVAVPTTLPVQVNNNAGVSLFVGSITVPDPQVTLMTSKGTFVVELNLAKAPVTVDNFLQYTRDGFYSNVLFHRTIYNFMVQTGGYSSGLVLKPTRAAIVLETNKGLSNLRGTLAMARTSLPNSATAQFFINQIDNTFLDYANASSPGYAVFGKVVSGLAVVDAIAAVPTSVQSGMADVPTTEVLLQSATQTR